MMATDISTTLLVVDDEPRIRTELQKMLPRHVPGISVLAPNSLAATKNRLLLEISDGGMFDIRLGRWGIGESRSEPLNGHRIRNGIDLASFYHQINEHSPVGFYSSFLKEKVVREAIDKLRFDTFEIEKPLPPDPQEIKDEFTPVRNAMINASMSNPLISMTAQDYYKLSLNERFRLFKIASNNIKPRIDAMIKVWKGVFSWVGVLDGKVIRVGGAHRLQSVANLKIMKRYHTDAEVNCIVNNAKGPLFIFWNDNADMLEKVFKLAGENLSNMPVSIRSFFGLSMAGVLSELYLDGENQAVLRLCAQLDDVGKLEVAKLIFKRLSKSKTIIKKFTREFAEAGLPVVAEIFKSEVRKIEGKHTAWVELKKWSGGRTVSEPFDLERLRKCGVKYENQMFEFTVYENLLGEVVTNVEPSVAHEANPFDSMYEWSAEG